MLCVLLQAEESAVDKDFPVRIGDKFDTVDNFFHTCTTAAKERNFFLHKAGQSKYSSAKQRLYNSGKQPNEDSSKVYVRMRLVILLVILDCTEDNPAP